MIKLKRKRHRLLIGLFGASIGLIIIFTSLLSFDVTRNILLSYPLFGQGDAVFSQIKNKLTDDKEGVFSMILGQNSKSSITENTEKSVLTKIGVIADSHGYDENIKTAVADMKQKNVSLIIHLGDFTAGGESNYFKEAKEALSSSGVPFMVLPGDHDFNWVPTRSRANFEEVFGSSYDQTYNIDSVGIILFSNSNDEGDLAVKISWLELVLEELKKSNRQILFFSSKPLFNPYFTTKNDPNGEELIQILHNYGVNEAFAGDTHVFARYQDLSENLMITTVGAVGEYKNPLPQWVLVEVLDDYSVRVKPQPIVDF